jgi:ketol-acid reductoisomerase
MAKIYRDGDARLGDLDGRTVGIIGYGNQGRSQAQNLRDSGVKVVVGSPRDQSAGQAEADGFAVFSVAEATATADIVFLLVPDEILPQLYRTDIAPSLAAGNLLVFASGYNIAFGLIKPPAEVDVVMIAPRMIGRGVRETYLAGRGFPTLVAVGQDASGKAHALMLALAKAIGSTRMGAAQSSFEEETIVDLFTEHCGDVYYVRAKFEALLEAGIDADVALLELYASGEPVEVWAAVRDLGLWGQMRLHSRTSQYGQQVVALRHFDWDGLRDQFRSILNDIRSGAFAAEWGREMEGGLKTLIATTDKNLQHPMESAEDHLYPELGRRRQPIENWLRTSDLAKDMG